MLNISRAIKLSKKNVQILGQEFNTLIFNIINYIIHKYINFDKLSNLQTHVSNKLPT